VTKDQQVFVAGTWREVSAEHAAAARTAGVMIAAAGYSLACGPGTGIARHAIDGFRSVPDRPGRVRYYLPAQADMEAAGEQIMPGHDELIQTDLDYPMRNVWHVKQSSGLIAITGGDGTLEEILPALIDYGLPVGVLRGSGQAADALELLLDVFPAWKAQLLFSADPASIARFVIDRIARTEVSSLPRGARVALLARCLWRAGDSRARLAPR
jgi:predicted Rossmann-fold nucleotide-binding protein